VRIAKSAVVCALLLAGMLARSQAAELRHCVKVLVAANGEATLTNVCSDRLNLIYCVDDAKSPRSCAKAALDVTTLFPGSKDLIPSFAGTGADAVHWAACVYPEAPVEWKPGSDSPYTCRKTCVMC
jgi:hypothetical protein